jgi:hypothetical protein
METAWAVGLLALLTTAALAHNKDLSDTRPTIQATAGIGPGASFNKFEERAIPPRMVFTIISRDNGSNGKAAVTRR